MEANLVLTQHVFYSDKELTAGFSRCPITPDHAIIDIHGATSLTAMNPSAFVAIMLRVHHLSTTLSRVSNTRRCALVFDGATCISLIPLHGLTDDWKPVINEDTVYYKGFPGFITSKNGPQLSDDDLNVMRKAVTDVSRIKEPPDLTFAGSTSDQSLFARIIRGDVPNWKVWEDKLHVAFLTPFANTPGFTVLVPRKHLSSDIFSLSEQDYTDMLRATHTCANILIKAFTVLQCGFMFEGFEIDYAHIKLIPIHKQSRDIKDATQVPSQANFQSTYDGYVTSQPGPPLKNLDSVIEANRAMRSALNYNNDS